MCGIVGSVGERLPEERIKKAADVIAHRGPDDTGFFVDHEDGAYFAHQRLSIIDLSPGGHQPFVSEDGRYQVVYNGEIYNYLELKEELKGKYIFKTESDTEVLLASYIEWGKECVEHFNGMFAFIVWDTKTKTLFCARDRLGIKPFFYTHDKGVFRFASEIKALLAFEKRAENKAMISAYLTYGFYDHTNETFFDGVYMLEPGHTATFHEGKLTKDKYWDVRDKEGVYTYGDVASVRQQFRDLLADSIKLRFRSDVPVGINLSSGLDSNTLFSYAKKVTQDDIHLFSMCATDSEYDECSIIETILSPEDKKLWHTTTLMPEEFLDAAATMNHIQDQPYGGVPTIAYGKLNKLSQAAGVTVLLEGQGVDELLAGYKYYRIEFLKDLWRERRYPQIFEYVRRQKSGSMFKNVQAAFRAAELHSHDYSQDTTPLVHRNILDGDMVRSTKAPTFDLPFKSHLLNAQYRDLRYTKLPRVLRFNDHVSMAYGRELRVPFLDHRLVEFCFWLPPEHKISYNSQKVLNRKTFGDVLPVHVQQRQKVTFGAVQTPWLREHGKDLVYDLLNSESFKDRGYWDHKALMASVDAFFKGEGENSFFLWQAINLELWFREFID